MKPITTVCLLCIMLLSITCRKHDYCDYPPKSSTCDLVQSLVYMTNSENDSSGLFSQYRKEYDSKGRVNKVVAGLFTFFLYDSVPMLLKYDGNQVYFFDEKHPQDTFITATFDSKNRLVTMTEGAATGNENYNPFPSTEFYYTSNRLSGFKILYTGDTTRLTYDQHGNLIHMYKDDEYPDAGTFYTYDTTVRAKRQFYTDDFTSGGFISIYLAQFMGWLPDLEPVNKRLSWKEIFNEDPPYVFDEGTEYGHEYDENGNLVRYNDGTYINIWNCGAKTNKSTN